MYSLWLWVVYNITSFKTQAPNYGGLFTMWERYWQAAEYRTISSSMYLYFHEIRKRKGLLMGKKQERLYRESSSRFKTTDNPEFIFTSNTLGRVNGTEFLSCKVYRIFFFCRKGGKLLRIDYDNKEVLM